MQPMYKHRYIMSFNREQYKNAYMAALYSNLMATLVVIHVDFKPWALVQEKTSKNLPGVIWFKQLLL